MEALLANYASDDDEDSNPPPKSSSLPSPSSANLPGKPHPFPKPSLFSSLPSPKGPSGRDSSVRAMRTEIPDQITSENLEDKPASVAVPGGKRSSLFSALPPPKSSKMLPDPSIRSEPSARAVKRVVEFRPSIDMSVLKEEEDDDDSNARAKRWAAESDKPKGLASILPKPKYSGQSLGLGSGHSSSGRMSLEINNDHDDARRKDSTLSENINRLEKSDVRPNPDNGVELPIDVNVGSSAGTWGNKNSGYHQGLDSNDDQSQWSGHTTPYPQGLQESNEESQSVNYGSAYPQGLQSNNEEFPWLASHAPHDGSVSEEPFNTLMVHEATHGIETVEDPLANILMKERRKGGKVATPTVIEVKQSELTINKVREDQVRATGIAFGPSYQPVSNKGKPSKLHRRKHQIGTLYFDMKQKEMELMERRSRGFMSKAETQAKYGW